MVAARTAEVQEKARIIDQIHDSVVTTDLAGRIIGWNKGEFLGRQALADQKARGVARRIVGFEMKDRAIARHGYPVIIDGAEAGRVTSGTQTPFLKKAIGMAYVPAARAVPGMEFDVEIRGRLARATIVPLPFYKRPRG